MALKNLMHKHGDGPLHLFTWWVRSLRARLHRPGMPWRCCSSLLASASRVVAPGQASPWRHTRARPTAVSRFKPVFQVLHQVGPAAQHQVQAAALVGAAVDAAAVGPDFGVRMGCRPSIRLDLRALNHRFPALLFHLDEAGELGRAGTDGDGGIALQALDDGAGVHGFGSGVG